MRKSCLKIFAKRIIKLPATKKRMDAKKNGGNSVTAILLNKYVEPQITYIAIKARMMSNFEFFNGIF